MSLIIDERINPRLWQPSFLQLRGILIHLKEFISIIDMKNARVLDLGCGEKPYAHLFGGVKKYVGTDIMDGPGVDVVAPSWELPFRDNEFDVLVSTQSLEHTQRVSEAIVEMRRVVEPGGLIFVSVPFLFPEHGVPYDYWRWTKHGISEAFKDFEILIIKPDTAFFSVLFQFLNIPFSAVPFGRYLFFPLFFVNNFIGLSLDSLARFLSRIPIEAAKDAYRNTYSAFTNNYCVVLRNKK